MSATTSRAGLELRARELEQRLVLLLLGVEEDDVEHVVDLRQRLERVALDQVGRVVQPGLGEVRPPGLALGRVVLEREHAAAEWRTPAASQIVE